jgi:hypothetical protein
LTLPTGVLYRRLHSDRYLELGSIFRTAPGGVFVARTDGIARAAATPAVTVLVSRTTASGDSGSAFGVQR